MKKTFTNIGKLYGTGHALEPKRGSQLDEVQTLQNAYLKVEDGLIVEVGEMKDLPSEEMDILDLNGAEVLPTFVDSHTHLVFGKDRKSEFLDRLNGLTYQEIAKRGGGILNSAASIAGLPEEELYDMAVDRLTQAVSQGTGAIEIKSGYGLYREAELKLLRVIKRLKADFTLPIKSTFLAAHAVPLEYKNRTDDYVQYVIQETLPAVAEEALADYIDVFCEDGYFTANQMERILEAGATFGMKPKVHVNQFESIGGVEAAIGLSAVSLDHLETLSEVEAAKIARSGAVATGLPACSHFLGIPYTPMRQLINHHAAVALATDFNPGSSPTSNMGFVFSLACQKMKLTPNEALNASTWNAACAMEVHEQVGSLAQGKKASFIVLNKGENLTSLGYYMNMPLIADVFLEGVSVKNAPGN
jgi:imidazolonepropionase